MAASAIPAAAPIPAATPMAAAIGATTIASAGEDVTCPAAFELTITGASGPPGRRPAAPIKIFLQADKRGDHAYKKQIPCEIPHRYPQIAFDRRNIPRPAYRCLALDPPPTEL